MRDSHFASGSQVLTHREGVSSGRSSANLNPLSTVERLEVRFTVQGRRS
jgi:hypothetical protein